VAERDRLEAVAALRQAASESFGRG
jgi:hypothetical protein